MNYLKLSLSEFKNLLINTKFRNIMLKDEESGFNKAAVTKLIFYAMCEELDDHFNMALLEKYNIVPNGPNKGQSSGGAVANVIKQAFNVMSAEEALRESKIFVEGVITVGDLLDKMINYESNISIKDRYENLKNYLRNLNKGLKENISLIELTMDELKEYISSSNFISDTIQDPSNEVNQSTVTKFVFLAICDELENTFNESTLKRYKLLTNADEKGQESSAALANVIKQTFAVETAEEALKVSKSFVKDVTTVRELINLMIENETKEIIKGNYIRLKNLLENKTIERVVDLFSSLKEKPIIDLTIEEFRDVLSQTNFIGACMNNNILKATTTKFAFLAICKELEDSFKVETLGKYKLLTDGAEIDQKGQASSGALANLIKQAFKVETVVQALTHAKAFVEGISTLEELINKMIESEDKESQKIKYQNLKRFMEENSKRTI